MTTPAVVTDPPVSERQRRAMYAAAEGHSTLGIPKKVGEEYVGKAKDAAANAAGLMMIHPSGHILMLRRSDKGDHAGEWALPGGHMEDGEEPADTARREAVEEVGHLPSWDVRPLDRATSPEGVSYTTFVAQAPEMFTPRLSDEHTEAAWHKLDELPSPLHPGVAALMERLDEPEAAGDGAVAFDRGSVRTYDRDGHLKVERTHISKANVCPYIGREIPGWQALGLDRDRIYQMLRDPEELAKGAKTFDGKPLLLQHKFITADTHHKMGAPLTVGSVGTSGEYRHPYLDNGLTVWDKRGIDAIESEDQCELSSSYRFKADMTPGTFKGVRYDGVMRDIQGNHVAIVKEGRAGSDVVVADSALPKLEEMFPMTTKPLSRKAVLLQGAVMAYLSPKVASDAKLDLTPLLADVTSKNYANKKAELLTGFTKLATPLLVHDANLDDMHGFIDRLDKVEPAEDETAANAATPVKIATLDALPAFLKEKGVSDAEMDEIARLIAAAKEHKETPEGEGERGTASDEEGESVSPAALDAALRAQAKTLTKSVREQVLTDQKALREAEKFVRPWVGEMVAMDSAEEVYRTALTNLGVEKTELEGLPVPALRTILKAHPVPGSKPAGGGEPRVAMDSAATKSYNELFGGGHIRVLG